MTLRLIDGRTELRENIRRLEALLNAEHGLSAETRVAALASVVQAQSSLLAADAADKLTEAIETAQDDVATPLSSALNAFGDKADELVTAIQGRHGY